MTVLWVFNLPAFNTYSFQRMVDTSKFVLIRSGGLASYKTYEQKVP
jgi:hypothetical protein